MGNTTRTNASFTVEVTSNRGRDTSNNGFVVEILGGRGPKGLKGNGIDSVVYDSETYIITITDTDGNVYTTDPLKGDKGDTGKGISGIILNNDYTLTINFTEGDPVTIGPIRGATGNGIRSVTYDTRYHTLTITDTDGNETTTDSLKGDRGAAGTVFTPSVSDSGVLSWTNDNYEINPEPVDIPSLVREVYKDTVSGSTPVIVGEDNHRYICGEVSRITITPPVSGTIDVVFTSGSTAAILVLPNTVKMPAWFNISSLEKNRVYEINITDGVYGAVMSWPV